MKRDRKLPPLRALQAFEAGARLGNFTKAAEELHVTQTAISHQVRRLENFFEQKLFDRSRRDLVLTEAGNRLQSVSTDMLDELDKVSQELVAPEGPVSTPLRITLPPNLGSRWLAPRLGEFWSEQKVELNLIPSTELLDFQRDDIDLGIRCGNGQWAGLEAEFLMPINLMPICSPALLTGRSVLEGPADLSGYTLLHELNYDAWGEWLAAHDIATVDYRHGVICQDPVMLYDFAIRGQGVALASVAVITDELNNGTLLAPFGVCDKDDSAYYLVYRKSSLSSKRVRVFRDFVIRQAKLNPEYPH